MKLSRINTLLLVAIIAVNAFVIVTPLVPAIAFWAQHFGSDRVQKLNLKLHTSSVPVPVQNRLVVPSMLLDEPINDGKDLATLRKGLWRLPYTSTPDKQSNTVVVGHRFTYANPRGLFYHLDKVRVGDEIGVFWQGKKYVYKVSKTETVPPTAMSIETSTDTPQLTLYTCAPLWWPKDRLVVTAKLEALL